MSNQPPRGMPPGAPPQGYAPGPPGPAPRDPVSPPAQGGAPPQGHLHPGHAPAQGYAPAGYGHAPAQGYAPAGYGHAPAQGAGHGYAPAGQVYVGYTQGHGPGQPQRLEAIACPQCQQPTTALKAYKVITLLVFVWFFAWFRHGTLVACPPCMRKKLGVGLLVNLVPANVLWPLLVLPWNLVQILRSYTGGHSSAARALLRQTG